jgi:hypothetical protein
VKFKGCLAGRAKLFCWPKLERLPLDRLLEKKGLLMALGKRGKAEKIAS